MDFGFIHIELQFCTMKQYEQPNTALQMHHAFSSLYYVLVHKYGHNTLVFVSLSEYRKSAESYFVKTKLCKWYQQPQFALEIHPSCSSMHCFECNHMDIH